MTRRHSRREAWLWLVLLTIAFAFAGCDRGGSKGDDATRATGDNRARNLRDATNNTPAQNKELARYLIRQHYPQWKGETEFRCLDRLWYKESHWNHRAVNKRTGACGIPQSYPCKKMAAWGKTYGVSYRRNPWPQIAWGLEYIEKRYGSPCTAWRRFQRGRGY